MDPFEDTKNTPQYWYNKSLDLRGAAGTLWCVHNSDVHNQMIKELNLEEGYSLGIATSDVFPMLCGLSLELMFKAIYIALNINFPPTHELVSLSKKLDIELTEEEIGLLKIFTEAAIWFGKYPVPLDKRKQAFEQLPQLYREYLTETVAIHKTITIFQYNDLMSWKNFNFIWQKASKKFHSINSKHTT